MIVLKTNQGKPMHKLSSVILSPIVMDFCLFSSCEAKISQAISMLWVKIGLIVLISLGLPSASFAQKSIQTSSGIEALTVVSLDMCADQYALGLMSKSQILGLSYRARLEESYFRERVAQSLRVKPKLETLLALKPKAVLRTYGGDPRLIMALKARGINVIDISDVNSLTEARAELLRVGAILGQDFNRLDRGASHGQGS